MYIFFFKIYPFSKGCTYYYTERDMGRPQMHSKVNMSQVLNPKLGWMRSWLTWNQMYIYFFKDICIFVENVCIFVNTVPRVLPYWTGFGKTSNASWGIHKSNLKPKLGRMRYLFIWNQMYVFFPKGISIILKNVCIFIKDVSRFYHTIWDLGRPQIHPKACISQILDSY